MAQFQGDIVLRTLAKFDPSFNKVITKIEQVSDLVNKLNKEPLNIFGKSGGPGGDIAAKQLKGFQDAIRNVANSGDDAAQRVKLLGNTVASTAEKAQVFAAALENVRLKSGGLSKQEATVKNLGRAWAIATDQATTYDKRLSRIQNDAFRERQGLQPQSTRDIEVEKRKQIINNARLKSEQAIEESKRRQQFLDERAARTAEKIARIQDAAAKKQQQRENLRLGIGFPLLFGGGPGSVAGGALGALSDSGGGFGGQVLFSAIGAQIDEAIKRVRDFGNALNALDVDGLADALGTVTAELASQVDLLIEQGRYIEARAALQKEITQQTGLVGDSTADVTNAVNLLNNGWREIVNAVSATLAIIGAPFAAAIGGILSGLAVAVKGINVFLTITGDLLKSWTRFALVIAFGEENVRKLEEALKDSNKQLDEGVRKARQLVNELSNAAVAAGIDLSIEQRLRPETNTENKIYNESIRLSKELLDIDNRRDEAIRNMRVELKNSTVEERAKAGQTIINTAEYQKQQAIIESNRKIQELTTKELEKQEKVQRRINDARISAQLAQDIFAAQPLPNATPFSRTSPEQSRDTAVEIQRLKYAAEVAKIENQKLTILEREAKLREAAAKNDLALLNINKQYVDTVKQREETRIRTFESAQLELDSLNAISNREREILQIDNEILQLQRSGIILTEAQAEAYKKLKLEIFDTANGLEAQMTALANTVGVELKNAMETALVDTIAAAITGADDLNEKLQATAASLLSTIGRALVMAGISGLAGNDGRGFFSFLQGGLGGRASGGPVNEGLPYIVGENGPELFVPGKSGTVVNNDDFADAAAAMSSGSSSFEESSEALEMATAARGGNTSAALAGAIQAFADSGSAMATASSNRASNSAAAAQASALQTAESYFATGKSTVTFDTYRVGEMDVVTREDAIRIGQQSAKQAEANVYKGLRNMPAVRSRSGVK